jgi:hypothetical protein
VNGYGKTAICRPQIDAFPRQLLAKMKPIPMIGLLGGIAWANAASTRVCAAFPYNDAMHNDLLPHFIC